MVDGLTCSWCRRRVSDTLAWSATHDTPARDYFKVPATDDARDFLCSTRMLATGGSAVAAVTALAAAGALRIRFLCILAAPEGVEQMGRSTLTCDLHRATTGS